MLYLCKTINLKWRRYVTHCDESNFQPMKANFGILPDLPVRVKKKLRKEAAQEYQKIFKGTKVSYMERLFNRAE